MTRPASALFAIIVAASVSIVFPACGYDWTVRDAPVRPDAASETAARDADLDAGTEAENPDGSRDGGDAGAANDAADACQALARTLADARDAGQACTQGSSPPPCQSKLIDECGCNRYLGLAGSSEAKRYENAIAQFKASGCPKDCPSFCPLTAGACLLSPPHCNP